MLNQKNIGKDKCNIEETTKVVITNPPKTIKDINEFLKFIVDLAIYNCH